LPWPASRPVGARPRVSGHTSARGLRPSSGPGKDHRPPPAGRAAAPSGRLGRGRRWTDPAGSEHQEYRRSVRRDFHPRGESPTSRCRRWARMRDAAEESRREGMGKDRGRTPSSPRDFAGREPQPANAMSPRVERRTSVNRSPCGRRTSLPADTAQRQPPCV